MGYVLPACGAHVVSQGHLLFGIQLYHELKAKGVVYTPTNLRSMSQA